MQTAWNPNLYSTDHSRAFGRVFEPSIKFKTSMVNEPSFNYN